MSCEEKARLLAEYEAATQRFSTAVTELNGKMGTSARTEYDRLQRVSDEALKVRASADRIRRTPGSSWVLNPWATPKTTR
jgi:hypothetical protein